MTKTNFDNTVSSLDSKIANNKTKNKSIENEFKKLRTFDLGSFIGKRHFEEEYGVQNYLVFQPIRRYFKITANTKYISSWKSKGLSDETIKPYATSDNSPNPLIDYYGSKIRVRFKKGCLKQSRVNIYIVYELGASSSNDSDPTLKNCLFGAVTLTKKADIEKYGYSGYGIGFDRKGSFFISRGRIWSKCINFRGRYEFFCSY